MITFTTPYTYCAGRQAALVHPSGTKRASLLTLGETVGTVGRDTAPSAVLQMHQLLQAAAKLDDEAIHQAARQTLEHLHSPQSRESGAATLVTACGTDDALLLAHIGDCRAYLFNPYSHRQIFCTDDHSAVQEAVKAGILTPEEARANPHRHRLTSCLTGVCPTAILTIDRLQVATGDRLLLCTPAVSYAVADADWSAMLTEQSLPEAAAQLRKFCQERSLQGAAFLLAEVDQPNAAAERWESKAFLGKTVCRWNWGH